MDENKMHLINKIFNNETIRTVWDKDEEKYYISIVDIVGVLAESKHSAVYWRVLKKRLKEEGKENLRDNMDNIELILTDLSEEAAKRLAAKQKTNGLKENIKVAKMGGHAAKVARDDIEKNLGESVVTKTNKLNYKYIEEEEKQIELKENDKKKLK